ncbi:MAG: DUF2867 domain-containing protein [Longimicrobiales bacterium]
MRYKTLIIAGVVVLLIVAGLLTLETVGRSRGVSRVAVPSSSMIEKLATDADYADSYMWTVPAALFPDTRALDRFAFQRSAVAGETSDEIMYMGGSSGHVYHISYLRRREDAETKLHVSTTVHYKNWSGWLYFTMVRPGHRRLTPYMVSVMIRQAAGVAR